MIKEGGKYYLWYSKVNKGSDVFQYPSGYSADVWYATSLDGHQWTEQGEAIGKGGAGAWDEHGVFTPNILRFGGKHYLYYTAVAAGHDNSTPTHIGVAVADAPVGPWRKFTGMIDKVNGIDIEENKPIMHFIRNVADLRKMVSEWAISGRKLFCVDCEWAGNNHVDGRLRSIQFGWSANEGACVTFMNSKKEYTMDASYVEVGAILGSWLNRPDVKYVGHFIRADLPWMSRWLNLDWYDKCVFDTAFALQTVTTVIKAARNGVECVRLTDPKPSRDVIAALEELGFAKAASGWVKPVLMGFHASSTVAERLESLGLPNGTLETGAQIDALGTLIWPGKLECLTITCYLIPIEARWAEHFFDTDLAARRIPGLSGIREDLHLGVEGVYYSGSNVGMKAPGIILWYVSKGSEGFGSMQVKAMSRLREVVCDTPKALFRRFSRLGVYAWKDVYAAAKEDLDANLTALRFSHTELFAKPLEKEELGDFNIPHPYGPRVIPFATFRQIYNHAFPNTP